MKLMMFGGATMAAAVLICPAASAQDATSIWKSAVKKCAASALQGGGTIFLGISSDYPPGTIFVRKNHGRTNLQWRADAYIPAANRATYVQVNNPVSCAGKRQSSFAVRANADLSQFVPATVGIDLSKARTVTVEPAAIAWEELVVGPYEELVQTTAAPAIRKNLLVDGMPVLTRAVRVDGIKTTLNFDSRVGAELSKLPLPVGVSATWASTTELTITSQASFYIAGQLSSFNGTSLKAAGLPPLVRDRTESTVEKPAAGG